MGKLKEYIFLVKVDHLLEKQNSLWDKVSVNIRKGFDREPVFKTELLKTKIKCHGDRVTDVYDKKKSYLLCRN